MKGHEWRTVVEANLVGREDPSEGQSGQQPEAMLRSAGPGDRGKPSHGAGSIDAKTVVCTVHSDVSCGCREC